MEQISLNSKQEFNNQLDSLFMLKILECMTYFEVSSFGDVNKNQHKKQNNQLCLWKFSMKGARKSFL